MSGWTRAWVLWLIMAGCIEGPALVNRTPGDTLSEHIWKWFAMTGKPRQWRLRRFALLAFVAWSALHLLSAGMF